MPRALPDNYRNASRIEVGDEMHPVYGGWTEVLDKAYTPSGIRFVLADGSTFHARATEKLRSRRLPKES